MKKTRKRQEKVCNHSLALLGLKHNGHNQWYCHKCKTRYVEITYEKYRELTKLLTKYTEANK